MSYGINARLIVEGDGCPKLCVEKQRLHATKARRAQDGMGIVHKKSIESVELPLHRACLLAASRDRDGLIRDMSVCIHCSSAQRPPSIPGQYRQQRRGRWSFQNILQTPLLNMREGPYEGWAETWPNVWRVPAGSSCTFRTPSLSTCFPGCPSLHRITEI